MAAHDHRQMQEMFFKIFGNRPFFMWVFSASLQDAFLNTPLASEDFDAIGDVRGLAIEHQVRAAAGLHPTLLVRFETEVPRDISHVDCPAFNSQLTAHCTFRADFFSANALVRMLKCVGEGLAAKHSRAGQVVHEPMNNGSLSAYWPLCKGDRIFVLYAGRVPLPDTRPQA